jgi:Mg-chelatase subunit ChlD
MIFLFPVCSEKVDLVFVLDSSTSVGQSNFDKMKDFLKTFLHSAAIDSGDVRVGILSYSTTVTIEFHLNQYNSKQELFTAIDDIPWRYGSTNTADALQTMHETMFSALHGDRPNIRNIAIVITDGVSNINQPRTQTEAKNGKEKNIHIYVIGIGLTEMEEVNGIASFPASANAFAVKNFDELEGLDEKIFQSICESKI